MKEKDVVEGAICGIMGCGGGAEGLVVIGKDLIDFHGRVHVTLIC